LVGAGVTNCSAGFWIAICGPPAKLFKQPSPSQARALVAKLPQLQTKSAFSIAALALDGGQPFEPIPQVG
jgi:hypothetical protein